MIGGIAASVAPPYSRSVDPTSLLRLVFKSDQFVAASFEGHLQKVRAAAPAINSGLFYRTHDAAYAGYRGGLESARDGH